jgi:hypothetical protein
MMWWPEFLQNATGLEICSRASTQKTACWGQHRTPMPTIYRISIIPTVPGYSLGQLTP